MQRRDTRQTEAMESRAEIEERMTEGKTSSSTVERRTESAQADLSLLRAALDSTSEGIIFLDPSGKPVSFNRSFVELWQIDSAESDAETEEDVVSHLLERVRNPRVLLEARVRSDSGSDREVRGSVELKDGRIFEYRSLHLQVNGRPAGQMWIFQDVTREKEVEKALQESRALLESLVGALPEVVYFKDTEGRNLIVNRAFEKLVGRPRAEIVGKKDSEIFPPELAEHCRASDALVLEARRPQRTEEAAEGEDGKKLYFDTIKAPTYDAEGNVSGLVGVSRDITERKRNEQALEESERFLRSVFDGIADGISVLDPELNVVRVNKWMEEMYAGRSELVGRKCYEVYQMRDAPCPWCPVLKTLQTGKPQVEIVPYAATGRPRGWIELSSFPLKGAQGRTTAVIEHVKDITDRKKAEEALKESEERYRLLVQNIPVGLYRNTPGPDGRFIMVNPAMARLFGYGSVEELLEISVSDLYLYPSDRRNFLEKLLAEGEVVREEIQVRRRDGTPFWAAVTARVVRDESGAVKYFDGEIEDIDERKRMAEELLRSRKFESLGALAGGIAHDFNNLLTSIMSNLSLVKDHVSGDQGVSERLARAEKACVRAKDLTEQLLTFSKGGAPVLKVTSIAKLVRETAELAVVEPKVKCEVSVPDDLWMVRADQVQLSQVIANLVTNACQAMPGGGTVKVSAGNLCLDSSGPLPLSPGRYIYVSVQDEGQGIPPEALPRIFDPYFTTKTGGSGLGLATSYSIVKKHGGHITVESEPGTGARFWVHLPAVNSTGENDRAEPDASGEHRTVTQAGNGVREGTDPEE